MSNLLLPHVRSLGRRGLICFLPLTAHTPFWMVSSLSFKSFTSWQLKNVRFSSRNCFSTNNKTIKNNQKQSETTNNPWSPPLPLPQSLFSQPMLKIASTPKISDVEKKIKMAMDKLVEKEMTKRLKEKSLPKKKAQLPSKRSSHITYRHLLIIIIIAGGVLYYLKSRNEAIEKKNITPVYYGKQLIGGPFELEDTSGKTVTDKDLRGQYSLLYFGFTQCPDICPNELKKMRTALDIYKKKGLPYIQPVFITIDPNRDTNEVMLSYAGNKEFPENILCLTGTNEQVKKAADAYRTYFSFPEPEPDGTMDPNYLIDHSIHFHLVNQKGEYLTHFGRSATYEQVAKELERIVQFDQN